MIIAVDIGNSNISLALWNNMAWGDIYRIDSGTLYEVASYVQVFETLLEGKNKRDVDVAIISSVVPNLTPLLKQSIELAVSCKIVLAKVDCLSPLSGDIPKELGQDLFANAVSGFYKSQNIVFDNKDTNNPSAPSTKNAMASIVIDMGTALTFIAVRSNGTIAGVAISTGIETSYKALVGSTAQINKLALAMPKTALGTDTQSALDSGIILGYKHLISGMALQIQEELHEPCKIYATGGLSHTMSTLSPPVGKLFDEINLYHTLDGLRILAEYNT